MILFTINVGIGTYFVYFHWYLKKDVIRVKFGTHTQTTIYECNSIELINGKSQTNRDQKSNLLFLQRHDQSQKFRIKLVKNRQKNITKALIFTTLDTLQFKKLMIVKVITV